MKSDKRQQIMELREQGKTIREIQEITGLKSPASVFHYFEKEKLHVLVPYKGHLRCRVCHKYFVEAV